MQLRYGTMEQVLMIAMGLGPLARRAVFERIKRFIRSDVPRSAKVGPHAKALYGLPDVLELALALTMQRAGMSPQLTAQFVRDHRSQLLKMWSAARSQSEPVLLTIRIDSLAAPQEVKRPGERKSVLRGMEILGPWNGANERLLPVTYIDLSDLLHRITEAMKMVRSARILAANLSLSDEVIEGAVRGLA